MLRFFIVTALLAASPAWSYQSHEDCIRVQVALYDMANPAIEAGSAFGRLYRKNEVGVEQGKKTRSEFLKVEEAFRDLVKAHAEYCRQFEVK